MNSPGKTSGHQDSNRRVETVEFRLSSDPKLLKIVRAGIAHLCELTGFTPEQRNQTTLAVDEACTNIIKYAYDGETDRPIIVTARLIDDGIEVVLRDFGKKAAPAEIRSRDLNDVRPGGLGVHLIRSTMDEVSYETNPGQGNQLTLTKYRDSSKPRASDESPQVLNQANHG